MLKSQQSSVAWPRWRLLQLQFVLSINLYKYTEGVTHLTAVLVLKLSQNDHWSQWEPDCLRVTQAGPWKGPKPLWFLPKLPHLPLLVKRGWKPSVGCEKRLLGPGAPCDFLTVNIFFCPKLLFLLSSYCTSAPLYCILKKCTGSDETGCAAEQAGQSPPAPHISLSYGSAKVGNRLPGMVASSISQLLTPKPQRLPRPSPQPSSARFQHRSDGSHVTPAMPGHAGGTGWDGTGSDGTGRDGMGWATGCPGSKGLLVLDRRILIYTIRDKSIINPALINCSGNGKELSMWQPRELKTKYNLREGKRGWVFENTFLKRNRNLGKVFLSSPHSPSLCSEMGAPAFPLRIKVPLASLGWTAGTILLSPPCSPSPL